MTGTILNSFELSSQVELFRGNALPVKRTLFRHVGIEIETFLAGGLVTPSPFRMFLFQFKIPSRFQFLMDREVYKKS